MSAPGSESLLQHESPRLGKAGTKTRSFERFENYADGSNKRPRRHTTNYKPVFLRPVSLILLFFLTLTLIGVLEYAVIRFPHRSVSRKARIASPDFQQDGLIRRSSHPVAQSNDREPVAPALLLSSVPVAIEGHAVIVQRSAAPSASTPPSPSALPSSRLQTTDSLAFVRSASSSATAPSAFVRSRSASPRKKTTSSMKKQPTSSAKKEPTSSAQKASPTETGTVVKTTANQATTSGNAKTSPTALRSNPASGTDTEVTTGRGTHYSSSASSSAYAATSSANAQSAGPTTDTGEQDQHIPLGASGTFASQYLPTISAVIYRMFWNVISSSFNLVEPFRLLARPEGASPLVAFFSSYQNKSTLPGCISRNQWALAILTFTASVADLLPALASESIHVSTNWADCPNRNPAKNTNPCPRRVETQVIAIRAMQGILVLACAVLLWLFVFLSFSKTGLTCDPRSMATVASLMCHDGLLHDFNEIPGDANSREMKRILNHTQYRLAHFEADYAGVRYGIQPSVYSDSAHLAIFAHDYGLIKDRNELSASGEHRQQRDWFNDLLLSVVILGTFGVVLAYYLDSGSDGFNNFFNSDSFGPRFILTLAATGLATLWKRAEISTMVMAPYQRLAKMPSSPESTILFKACTTPLISTARALYHHYFIVAAVTIVVLLADLALNIVIGGVPYAEGQSLRQSRVSMFLSMGILGVMFLASISLLISRFRSSYLPRRPDTLGIVMSYLAGGHMPHEFGGTEHLNDDQRSSTVRTTRKMYQLLETRRADGTYKWTVDEV